MTRRIALLLIAVLLCAPITRAQEKAVPDQAAMKVEKGDTVRSVLAKHVGKRVTVVLDSGAELTGTVREVGDHAVHLSELTGKEFFDAVVDLGKVDAVVVRVR